ncbi:putative HD superfamily hydrolase involved in NAD metabolism [Desulfohalotomaculum tongense]|uniref:bis(5'-nucleosyl)-tetraphosphatase (symmetrical) YqeK n=1 Tax=Desulforadius tongensis TaxID=1216062 RepID=UPI00195D5A15|nr:bis(5'-nucleosyl)-tetraphosphatase (symmetrical) YqeK [Desulforadius tongensis]MBM7855688.1 putative HD superfamily hydrolase involved in NAD metabolism [Desulforadius tongensis]
MDNIAEIKEQIKRQMSSLRFKHTLGVMQTAVNLAKRFQVNPRKAELAALLHDCARDYTDEQLLQLAHRFNLKIDQIQESLPAMLHGPVGAELAKQKFGVRDEEVLQAIAVHTFGAVNMSDTAKILMLADATEPGRKYNGVEDLRQQISGADNLNQAVLHCIEFKIRSVLKCKCLLHPAAVSARNQLLLKINNPKGTN